MVIGTSAPAMARTRRSNSPSASGKLSANAAPCRSRYTPSSGAASKACDRCAQISAAMRSNAASCTGPAGLAMHHANGTSCTSCFAAAAIAPAMGTDVPCTASISAAPCTRPGKPPGRTKSA
jgi:hypothetical protein